jgi:hypothetical protein
MADAAVAMHANGRTPKGRLDGALTAISFRGRNRVAGEFDDGVRGQAGHANAHELRQVIASLIFPASAGLMGTEVDAAARRERPTKSAAFRTVGREANRTAGV